MSEWGAQLRWWREHVRNQTMDEFVDDLLHTAELEHVSVDPDTRLLGRWERGEVACPRPRYRRLLAQMGAPMPGSALLVPCAHDDNSHSLDDVDRRNFLGVGTAAAGAALTEPWQRLTYALEHNATGIDADMVEAITGRTRALFDLEEHVTAQEAAGQVASNLDAITTLLGNTAPASLRSRLLADAGATAALAGWLAFDRSNIRLAERYYTTATRAGEDAGDHQLVACVLAYRSYLASAAGDRRHARDLLIQAQARVHAGGSAAMDAWLGARAAEESAALGDRDEALRNLERATTVYDYVTQDQPVWTKFFTRTRLDGIAVACAARLRPRNLDATSQQLLGGLAPGDTKVASIALGDAAFAHLAAGDLDRGASLGRQAAHGVAQTDSRVGRERLQAIEQALAPYGSAATARATREHLAAAVHQPGR